MVSFTFDMTIVIYLGMFSHIFNLYLFRGITCTMIIHADLGFHDKALGEQFAVQFLCVSIWGVRGARGGRIA